MKRKALVLGAGGFIGSHLVEKLRGLNYFVRGVDLKYPEFSDQTAANEFIIGDLRDPAVVNLVFNGRFDEVYQLAADMGGAEFIFTGNNDADILHNNLLINVHSAYYAAKWAIKRFFFSSSACVYPEANQLDYKNPITSESSAYPAAPDSEYGWEKLMAERLYLSYMHNYRLDVRIARFHNIYGPWGTFEGGREKAPAALCRKVINTAPGGTIEILGDGMQTRSFLYISECIRCVLELMGDQAFYGPVNIGSDEMVSIDHLAKMVINISEKKDIKIKHKIGSTVPTGVRGRTSDNRLYAKEFGAAPDYPLSTGIAETYRWIHEVINNRTYNIDRDPDSGKIWCRAVT